jgi:hypothetical protein
MRVSRTATILWGVAQTVVALGAQYVTRSVLDAGLSVLSLAAGPVLGAFLIGVLTRRVGPRAILMGMIAGTAIVGWAWWTASVAWTWFAFLGVATTAAIALILAAVRPQNDHG